MHWEKKVGDPTEEVLALERLKEVYYEADIFVENWEDQCQGLVDDVDNLVNTDEGVKDAEEEQKLQESVEEAQRIKLARVTDVKKEPLCSS